MLFAWALTTSRRAGVEEHFAGFSDAFEVALPVERTAPGKPVQVRLFGQARRLWAPGMLGVTRGAAAFMPAKPKHSDRAWGGDVESFEVGSILGQASYLRLHTSEGQLQFAVQASTRDLRAQVGPWLSQPPLGAEPEPPAQEPAPAVADHQVDPSLGTNLRVLTDTLQDPQPGDIFALAPQGEVFLFGRVISTRAQWTRSAGPGTAILIYLYAEWSTRKEIPDPAALGPDLLLVPPILTNTLPWRHGIFETLGNVPLAPGDVLETHCFRSTSGQYYDGMGQELDGPVEPVGTLGLHSFRSIDDVVSDEIGIPRAP